MWIGSPFGGAPRSGERAIHCNITLSVGFADSSPKGGAFFYPLF